MILYYLPFLIQGIAMGVDEHLHEGRGLGKWERWGHPLDTLTVFIPLCYVALHDFTQEHLTVFGALALFSCLFITKDEFVHARECGGLEHWLHGLLFILHPLVFLATGVLWKFYPGNKFLIYQPLFIGLFMAYQLLRWSLPWNLRLR